MLSYVVAPNGAEEDFLGKKEHVGTFGAQGCEVGPPLVVAIDELRGYWLLRKQKKKQELNTLASDQYKKVAQVARYSCSCFAVR